MDLEGIQLNLKPFTSCLFSVSFVSQITRLKIMCCFSLIGLLPFQTFIKPLIFMKPIYKLLFFSFLRMTQRGPVTSLRLHNKQQTWNSVFSFSTSIDKLWSFVRCTGKWLNQTEESIPRYYLRMVYKTSLPPFAAPTTVDFKSCRVYVSDGQGLPSPWCFTLSALIQTSSLQGSISRFPVPCCCVSPQVNVQLSPLPTLLLLSPGYKSVVQLR